MEPVELFERAATAAAALAATVEPGQHHLPTPCAQWDIAALVEHLAGGPGYLAAALGGDDDPGPAWPDPAAVDRLVARLREPGALDRRCQSPAGFEWSVGEATAGTAMDQLVHTWDLAVAVGADRTLDGGVTAAIVALFLPDMPEIGRRAGLVGPAVPVVAGGASPQDVLLGAMGRDPSR